MVRRSKARVANSCGQRRRFADARAGIETGARCPEAFCAGSWKGGPTVRRRAESRCPRAAFPGKEPRLALRRRAAEGWGVNSGEQLCLACGLCCDGTLFDKVRLGPGDDAEKLKALGLPVAAARSGAPITHFRQPCAALCADRSCRVYADRPGQCRTFECGVYKAVGAGAITFAVALRRVKQARRRADDIRGLLRKLGDTEENRPLSDRFLRTKRRLEAGGADAAAGAAFAELGLAMHRFNLLAHERFYTRVETEKRD